MYCTHRNRIVLSTLIAWIIYAQIMNKFEAHDSENDLKNRTHYFCWMLLGMIVCSARISAGDADITKDYMIALSSACVTVYLGCKFKIPFPLLFIIFVILMNRLLPKRLTTSASILAICYFTEWSHYKDEKCTTCILFHRLFYGMLGVCVGIVSYSCLEALDSRAREDSKKLIVSNQSFRI